jgi:hypothetical protein
MVAFASRFGVRGNRMDIGVGVGHGSAYILFALLSHVSAGKAIMVTAGTRRDGGQQFTASLAIQPAWSAQAPSQRRPAGLFG